MNIIEAARAMREGKRVRPVKWRDGALKNRGGHAVLDGPATWPPYPLSLNDILGEWEIVEGEG